MQILCILRYHPVRLGQLKRLIPRASKKALVANLRDLELKGIIIRRDRSGMVRHVEFDFSEQMRTVMDSVLDHLAEVGDFYAKNKLDEAAPPDTRIEKAE